MSVTRLCKALGWAVYLACSWTWCIGMFLPVILLRDFGWPSWIVFVAPNVIGAAAMGFVMSDRRTSEEFVARHKPACVAFSVVTILFQLYFLLWAGVRMQPRATFAGGLLVILALIYWFSRPQGVRGLVVPGLVFVFSVVAMIVFVRTLPFARVDLSNPAFGKMAPQLWILMPVLGFGFLFSPYLDLTFHHASQQTSPGLTKVSFVLGFGLLFFSMMVFTLLYAPSVITAFFDVGEIQDAGFQLTNRTGLCLLLFAHFVVQAGFTMILHLHRLKRQLKESLSRNGLFVLLAVAATVLLVILGRNRAMGGLSGHELIYRSFMAFYGLFAPCYVWTCVIPFKNTGLNRTVDWITCGWAICLALPFFAWAFLGQGYYALAPGLGIVLVAPLLRGCYYKWHT